MIGGRESLIWFSDKDRKQFVCSSENHDKQSFNELGEEENRRCADVNQIVGTEHW